MNLLKTTARSAIPALLVIAVWTGLAWTVEATRGIEFPTPWDTGVRLAALIAGSELSQHSLYRHVFDSFRRWGTGFAMATVAGVLVGLGTGWSVTVRKAVAPVLHLLQLVPSLAWIPVALLLFGLGETATLFMITTASFTPIAISVMDGVNRVDTQFLRAARMLGARRKALFFNVLLPGALPALITGLRIGLGHGWRVVVAAEMIVGTGTGLGYSIIEARWTLDYASAFACVALICAIGLLVEGVVFARLERTTLKRWSLGRDAQ